MTETHDKAKPGARPGRGSSSDHRDESGPASNGHNPSGDTLYSAVDWLARDLPQPDYLLGQLISTTSRLLLIGETGIGKTMFGLPVANAVAKGEDFLHWKGSGRPRKGLYVDGEMSRQLMQARLRDEHKRSPLSPNLIVLSKQDFEDMPALNTVAGQVWMDNKIKQIDAEHVFFDNIQSLLDGDMKDEEAWAPILPWVRDLTRRRIMQGWLHHTGIDTGRGYGTKTREWQMDTVAIMGRSNDPAPMCHST